VIIDHGNDEFSALMHMQLGSVTVKVGDKVTAGQVVGKLGHSGDAFGVHLHYQLQDGPKLFQASSLPIMFKNVRETSFSRGAYLTPH
ncbi:MAG TPA: M23 family metallopeptidase, partial [Candidatus Eisenbacteria bacterium]